MFQQETAYDYAGSCCTMRNALLQQAQHIFLQPKNFLLMRYNVDFLSNPSRAV
jgi:hypothetical protein